jgi:hypothetical protein
MSRAPARCREIPTTRARNPAGSRGGDPGNDRALTGRRGRRVQRSPTTSNEAPENTMNQSKIPSLVGAGIGLALFLAVALLPAMLYGGYAGVLLAGGIFGTPLHATFLVRALIVFGIVLGVVAVGSLFAVAGAAAGAGVGALAGAVRKPATEAAKS